LVPNCFAPHTLQAFAAVLVTAELAAVVLVAAVLALAVLAALVTACSATILSMMAHSSSSSDSIANTTRNDKEDWFRVCRQNQPPFFITSFFLRLSPSRNASNGGVHT
jgi:hypothetical protein